MSRLVTWFLASIVEKWFIFSAITVFQKVAGRRPLNISDKVE